MSRKYYKQLKANFRTHTYNLTLVHKVSVFCKMQCNEVHAEQFLRRDRKPP